MRVLVVLSEPDLSESMRERCSTLIAEGCEVAVCHVLPAQTGLHGLLAAQRKITSALRRALEASAENIPVFVVTGDDGDGVEDCARAWEATDVQT